MDDKALHRMACHADDVHREAMRALEADLGEAPPGRSDPNRGATRRAFLRRATTAGAAVAVGGAALPLATVGPAAAQTTASAPTLNDADIALVTYAQSLELAAVSAYASMVKTRLLDSTQTEVLSLFSRHHTDHSTVLVALLPKSQTAPPPNPKLLDALNPQISSATTAKALLQVAYNLESGLAATYQLLMGDIINQVSAGTAGSIEPVEAQHSVVLGQVVGIDQAELLPAFQTDSGAFQPQTYALPTS